MSRTPRPHALRFARVAACGLALTLALALVALLAQEKTRPASLASPLTSSASVTQAPPSPETARRERAEPARAAPVSSGTYRVLGSGGTPLADAEVILYRLRHDAPCGEVEPDPSPSTANPDEYAAALLYAEGDGEFTESELDAHLRGSPGLNSSAPAPLEISFRLSDDEDFVPVGPSPSRGAADFLKVIHTQRTSLRGTFELPALGDGLHWILVRHADYVPALSRPFRERAPSLSVSLRSGARLEVSLLASDGSATEGGWLKVEPQSPGTEQVELSAAPLPFSTAAPDFGAPPAPNTPRGSVPGPRLSARGVLPGTYRLTGWAPGHAPLQKLFTTRAGETTRVELRLPRGLEITGVARDERGQPLAGAHLVASPELDFSGLLPDVEARSLEDGTFTLRGLGAQTYVVAADAPEHAQAVEEVEAGSSLELVLSRTFSIRGRVRAEDASPLEDLDVSLGPGETWCRSKSGEYEFSGLKPGRYTLSAHSLFYDTRRPLVVEVRDRDLEEVELVLARGREVSVRVRDDRGEPIPSALVTLYRRDRSSTARTGEEGRALLRGVPHEASKVHVSARGLQAVIPLGAKQLALDVTLDRPGLLRGLLLTSEGAPQGGRTLLASGVSLTRSEVNDLVRGRAGVLRRRPGSTPDLESSVIPLRTDSAGKFAARLKAGPHRVWLVTRESCLLLTEEVTVRPGLATEVELRLPLELSLRGRVLRGDQPCPKVEVVLRDLETWGHRTETTDAQGRFEISGLHEGRYALTCPRVRRRVLTLSSDDPNKEVLLEATGPLLKGRVRPLPGLEEQWAWVHLLTPKGESAGKSLAGLEFRFDQVPPGSYLLIATAKGQISKPIEVTLAEGQELLGLVVNLERGSGLDLDSERGPFEGSVVVYHEGTGLIVDGDLDPPALRGLPEGPLWLAVLSPGSSHGGGSSVVGLQRVLVGPQVARVAVQEPELSKLRIWGEARRAVRVRVAGTQFTIEGGSVSREGYLDFVIPPGRFEVVSAESKQEVTLKPGQAQELKLTPRGR